MKQRYEILYKNNEFLQEYIGRELWLDQINGKNKIDGNTLNHSRTYVDIMQRILREHWKHCDMPVSPSKILIWSTDKDCKITSLSASHMIYDNKKKVTFSDLLTTTFGNCMATSWFSQTNDVVVTPFADDGTNVNSITPRSASAGANMWQTGGVGMAWQVGIGQQTGNLRSQYQVKTKAVSAPESGHLLPSGVGAFNSTSGLLSNGISFASGGTETLTEIATSSQLIDQGGLIKFYLIAYDLISFGIIPAQVVNIATSLQL